MATLEKFTEKPSRPKVLVVDDDPGMRTAIRLVLEPEHEIIEAESIPQSLTLFDRQEPDLITLDISMPEVDGIQGLDSFRHRSAKIPIILISGHHSFELAREALRLGANDYLTKPFSADELRRTIQSALTKVGHDDEDAADPDFKLRLPIQNLREEKFLSLQHRSHFLAFAQNVLSNKKRTFETISVQELIQTITIQLQALRLAQKVDCHVIRSTDKLRIKCDMYLLGGALANLALACILETRNDEAPVTLDFVCDPPTGMLRVVYKKSEKQLPEEARVRFERWHLPGHGVIEAGTAMLVLAEKVVGLHHGKFILNNLSVSGPLLELEVPLNQPTGA